MIRRGCLWAVGLALACAWPAHATPEETPLPEPIRAALAASGVAPAGVSILIRDADGQLRLDYQGSAPRQIASLSKLLTTLAALDLLGPAFRFHTDLLADPLPPGKGWQLALRGGGDPGLRFEDLRHLLRAARAAGVDRIGAPVILDSARFGDQPGATSEIQLEPDHVAATPPAALLVEQAAVQLTLPAEGGGQPLADPPLPVRLGAGLERSPTAPCPPDWPDALHLVPDAQDTARRSGLRSLRLIGSWPRACPESVLLRAPLAPGEHFALALAAAAHEAGLRGSLRTRADAAPGYARVMLRQASRPLSDLVRDINKYSNNVMARTLFLDLAAEAGELPATPAAAAQVVQSWLQRAGLHFRELSLENGAGLSHRELLSAEHLEALLEYALTSSASPEFLSSLAIPGQEGTLRTRFTELPGSPRLRLKTGSLDGVRTLAGYFLDRRGRAGTVVCLVNDPHAAAVPILQAAVLEWALRDNPATASSP